MQGPERARDLERAYHSRRGHAPQLSISDDTHHVTEAIGNMYDDDDYLPSSHARRTSRPLSFISSPSGDTLNLEPQPRSREPYPATPPKSPLRAHMNSDRTPRSPPQLSRTSSDTAVQQFPLNDIDYESSPAGLAQELSNLQAIRRMSMDVNQADPDLPSFQHFNLPVTPPAHFSEDEDPAKLFWVPARLHPELAPKEFKTFIEEKVDTIRRRSGDADSLSPDSAMGRSGSSGGLRRKKSMLSRQIDNANGYRDGAERLERKRSGAAGSQRGTGLDKLSEIVEDPSMLVRRMSVEAGGRASPSDAGLDLTGDMPILPASAIGGGGLKRSIRTNYRRGSLRKGERVPYGKRLTARQMDAETDESPSTSPTHSIDLDAPLPPNPALARVQSEPVNGAFDPSDSYSRSSRNRTPPYMQHRAGSAEDLGQPRQPEPPVAEQRPPQPKRFHSRIASNGRTTAPLPGYNPPEVPHIVETPPPHEPQRLPQVALPERNSSRIPPPSQQQPIRNQPHPRQPPLPQQPLLQQQPPLQQPPPPRQPSSRPQLHRQDRHSSPIPSSQSLDDLVAHPSAIPNSGTRTDSLSIIPNLVEERKPEKKAKDKKDGSEGGSRKTSWGWLLGSDDKEKDSHKKEKEDREKELAKRVKNKLSKHPEKGSDDTRLDVLQSSISGSRGRESVILDRDSIKLEEERKKESSRKTSSGDSSKKERDSSLFSSIFGGSKKKSEKSESSHKKGSSSLRDISPNPPPRELRPDIDYNWTRFSILEERAIYRMAHIKLANPRRELYSQVLLSNFMYSYLAKVQQMHPQIQIGTSKQAQVQQRQQAAQQQAQQQKKEKEREQEESGQYTRYQQVE